LSEFVIPVINITSPRSPKTVEVRVTPLSDDLYRVTMENKVWELTFLGLGDLGELIKEPTRLTEYKKRMIRIKLTKKCGFYPYCESPSKSKNWVCLQDRFSRLTGCAFFHIYITKKEEMKNGKDVVVPIGRNENEDSKGKGYRDRHYPHHNKEG